jgi:uncharacterized protein YidB (DUF937 family)
MGLFDQGFASKNGLSPAAIALLGLLAVKGFENRDKIGSVLGGLLGGHNNAGGQPGAPTTGGLGGVLGNSGGLGSMGGLGGLLGGLLGGGANGSAGNVVSNGLGDILNKFNDAGHGDVANSWVKDGPEQQAAPSQVEQAVGSDVLDQLAAATGLSRDELLKRLTATLPQAVDQLTPDSRVPSPGEANAIVTRRQA